MSKRAVIVFDMDGVLVDVSESYRETICRTVEHFTGRAVTRELVQEYKNRGGCNNDWLLAQRIAADMGVEADYQRVVDHFQKLFFGDGETPGLILRERWIARPGLLEQLAERHRLAIFTGRPRAEARMTLERCAARLEFNPLIAAEDVTHAKPEPEGLNKIRKRCPGLPLWYVGDTVDDARSARAAGVRFVGIAEPSKPHCGELVTLFEREKAHAVLDSINDLGKVLTP